MADAYIIDAVRTPRGIGKVGKGALAHLHPQHLAVTVLAALARRNALDTAEVDDVIWSTSMQRGKQGGNLARMAALDAGYDIKASGTTLDRFCGGGITAVSFASAQIMSGMEDLLVAGGTEMMSLTATIMQEDTAAGLVPMRMGAHNARLAENYPQPHQGVCADAIATLEGIGREALDALALESQRRACAAISAGRFDRSIVPVFDEAGGMALAVDEYPRVETTADGLAGLKPAFEHMANIAPDAGGHSFGDMIRRKYPGLKIEHVHHAGNSSGVVDGAAALLIASERYVRHRRLKARARIVATANVGDDPTLMLNAPVPAIRKVLARAGLSIKDIDVWEINEAFAAVVEKCIRDLGLDRAKVNINGGAIALGHPIGATGSILIGMALDELERTGGRYGLVTMCAAGGMAPAIVIERLNVPDRRTDGMAG
ncbi:acetyl-CoA C-acetyltransferase [Sphingosinicella microcystinivorans]|uniref:acetyl-CoA C-acetyltransferase n=1 Tax=Sphingosinicella microcystinivorans TaxID=335406 RepID=UPI0022F3C3F2|nr:acetyl-CoA C-acetyltransferase [Sphingosinicella microcystinivorans]WBX83771.1 acetyl-CoA C-acetyltransferase [Sphingosinicella microcystinivorans]